MEADDDGKGIWYNVCEQTACESRQQSTEGAGLRGEKIKREETG